MLVLTRKKNQEIVINGPATLTVVEIRGDKVRLGFNAPDSTIINRREIQNIIDEQNRNGGDHAGGAGL